MRQIAAKKEPRVFISVQFNFLALKNDSRICLFLLSR
jgi:hypothetical protein